MQSKNIKKNQQLKNNKSKIQNMNNQKRCTKSKTNKIPSINSKTQTSKNNPDNRYQEPPRNRQKSTLINDKQPDDKLY